MMSAIVDYFPATYNFRVAKHMQIRKNTKAFKTIVEIVSVCQTRPDREKLVRLYITKAGHSIEDRIHVAGIEGGDAAFFYDMTYQTVLGNLKSSTHQLWASDDIPGIYFFHTTSNKVWDEAPFEFDEVILKEFVALPELPAVRKREKAEKFVLSAAEPGLKSKTLRKEPLKVSSKKNDKDKVKSGIETPKLNFKLSRHIDFSHLDKIIFRQSKINKQVVLEYYDKIADYLLPHLKDRFLSFRKDAESQKSSKELTVAAIFPEQPDEMPEWLRIQELADGKDHKEILLCPDKEHLLYFVEHGVLEFDHSLSRVKRHDSSDYLMLAIDSPGFDISHAIRVALKARSIFEGLQLRSCVKTDGVSGLHVYVPLDGKSTFETVMGAATYLAQLIRLKMPDQVTLNDPDEKSYGKVSLDCSMNAPGGSVLAPYSLVPGRQPVVAVPFLCEELEQCLSAESFDHESSFRRIRLF